MLIYKTPYNEILFAKHPFETDLSIMIEIYLHLVPCGT